MTTTIQPTEIAPKQPETFWENVGLNRWSRYLVDIERAFVNQALNEWDKPGRFVEIGCDGGKWSQMFADRGWEVTCVDINPESLEVCRRRLPDANIVLTQADATTFPLEADQFDFALAIQVPAAAQTWFADDIARVLRPKGRYVFDFVNAASYRSLLSYLRSKSRGDDVHYLRNYSDVLTSYQQAGLSVRRTVGHAWAPFSRESNSPLIPWAANVERFLGLRNMSHAAPWVIASLQLDADQSSE